MNLFFRMKLHLKTLNIDFTLLTSEKYILYPNFKRSVINFVNFRENNWAQERPQNVSLQ